jgi:hypothetical protein
MLLQLHNTSANKQSQLIGDDAAERCFETFIWLKFCQQGKKTYPMFSNDWKRAYPSATIIFMGRVLTKLTKGRKIKRLQQA